MNRISKHYTVHHVEFDLYALKNKIDNKAPPHVIRNAELVAKHILEPIYDLHPNIISWYRSEALEREYNKFDYLNWCLKNRVVADSNSWQNYLSAKQHISGCAVTLLHDPDIVSALTKMDFDVLGTDTYIHVSYTQRNRNLIIDDLGLVK